MKKADVIRIFCGITLLLRVDLVVAAAAVTVAKGPTPHYSTVAPGLSYAHLNVSEKPWSIHIARLDRKKKGFDIVTALSNGKIQGLASLSQQMKTFPPEHGRPLAAINGDFFHIKPGPYQGDPEGLQILDGELVSAPADKSFWVGADGKLHIDHVHSRFEVAWPDGTKTPFGLNQPPSTNGVILFTPAFGASTETTNAAELVLEKSGSGPWLPLRAGQTYTTRVREIHPAGNTPLTPDALVLTVTGPAATNLSALQPGAQLTLTTTMTVDVGAAPTAIGGGPILVEDGKEQKWPTDKNLSSYLQPRHPRTALGFNDRYFYLVVVDGRQEELSMGMSFVELASFMKKLGCAQALNLDGGGSTTFWLNGKVMNSPSDKHERSLANAVVIVQKSPR